MEDGEASPNDIELETAGAEDRADISLFRRMRRNWARWVTPPIMVAVAGIGIVADVGGVAGLIWPEPTPLVLTEGSKDSLIVVLQQQIAELEAERDGASVEDRARLQARIDVVAEKTR